jgi:hypothetical protein
MKKAILSISLVLLSSACIKKTAANQAVSFPETDFPVRTATIDSRQFKFRIYSPKDAKPGERLPVMLYLHGSDERGEDNQGQLSGPAPLILLNPNNFHFIIVFPQCPAGQFWNKDMIGVERRSSIRRLKSSMATNRGFISRDSHLAVTASGQPPRCIRTSLRRSCPCPAEYCRGLRNERMLILKY